MNARCWIFLLLSAALGFAADELSTGSSAIDNSVPRAPGKPCPPPGTSPGRSSSATLIGTSVPA